ncbi:Tetraspanin-33 [Schistosoma japonicum]|nr:Tetraspanin-33 [Schistosoma japonicum]
MSIHSMGRRYHRGFTGRISYINQWVKYSLCLANFIFLTIGTVFLVFGAIAFIESGGIPWKSNITALQWLFNLTVICTGVGIITLFVSLAGFIGSLRENNCLLKFYYSILTLLFLTEVICCVLFFVYRESAIRKLEELIKTTFVTQYRELGFEDTTNFMDFIQKESNVSEHSFIPFPFTLHKCSFFVCNAQLNCCGPKSYLDWTANRYFSCNKSNVSPEACGVPYSCCRQMNNININVINTSCGFGVQKSTTAVASRLVWTTGCVQALINVVESNIVHFACGVSGVAVLQLLAILLAKTLHTQISDQLRLLRQENIHF